MFVKSHQPLTNSLRGSASLSFWYLQFKRHNRLSNGTLSKAGRGESGRKVVFSKGGRKYKKLFRQVCKSFLGLSTLSIIYEVQRYSLKGSLIMLLHNSLGCWFYLPLPNGFHQLDYIKIIKPKTSIVFLGNTWPLKLSEHRLYTKISYLSVSNNDAIKYVRSAGSTGLLLTSNFFGYLSIIIMPSKGVKLFNNQTVAFRGPLLPLNKRDCKLNKAGYNVNKGLSPKVRGTVKNANDHPNGGRNRSLLCSMTPWGYPAKKSRKEKSKSKIKALAKRNT